MDTFQKSNVIQSNKKEEQTSRNFVLRIWKTGEGSFKGYILDPLTDATYPLANMPQESILDGARQNATQGVLLEMLGCWIGLWSDSG